MFCRNCGKELLGSPEICPNCGAEPMGGTSFCPNCGALTTELTVICPKCGVRLEWRVYTTRREMSWFERHLNWTVAIAWLASEVLASIVIIVIILVAPFVPDEVVVGLWVVIYLLVILAVGGWALRKKNRSLAWLLILFVPIGWIVFLCLENRSEKKRVGVDWTK